MKSKYTILAFLFACFVFTSCIDDDIVSCYDDIPVDITNGYSLQFTVTLDNMGGTRAIGEPNPMKKWEDYIDPEKFRILFFNNNEEFLFESKSRWVKQLAPTADGFAQWLVSVPMFSYGNDVVYNWDWEAIRTALTTEKFKIAILVNRPEKEYYPGFSDTGFEDENKKKPDWVPNIGPEWTADDTSWGVNKKPKKLFDLHHCQYDPIYHAKSRDFKDNTSGFQDFYDFIMDDYDIDENGKPTTTYDDMRPKMGATSSWVEWDLLDENQAVVDFRGTYPYEVDTDLKDKSTSSEDSPLEGKQPKQFNAVRHSVVPSAKHPIPMYGVQEFLPITHWIKGTPFNLSQITENQTSDYKLESIALLRSVVKLELLLSKKLFPQPTKFVTLWYSNIYARCEPMDVWTSTKDLWKEHTKYADRKQGCEWFNIIDYGPVVSENLKIGNTTKKRKSNSKKDWQEIMSWFYGAWTENGPDGNPRWNFNEHIYSGEKPITPVTEAAAGNLPFPHIFNTCVQRNKVVICSVEGDLSNDYNDNYWHFVVYTGERNMVDPNTLPMLEGKNTYGINWIFKDEKNKKYYAIPIADYSTGNGKTGNQTARNCFGPYDISGFGTGTSLNLSGNMNTYGNTVRDLSGNNNTENNWPWPLMRNHVYRITIGPDEPANTRAATQEVDMDDFTIESHDYHSESLTPLN